VLHVFPHWDWPERLGESTEVWAFSNADEVELSLNGKSLGRKPVEKNGHVEWQVEYQPGELVAQSYRQGQAAESQRVETTTGPHALRLTGDFAELTMAGLLAVVCVSASDAQGRPVSTANVPVTFSITGPGRILGVGNGDPSCLEPDRYLPSLTLLDIENFREKALPLRSDGELAEVAPDFDDSDWPAAFQIPDANAKPDATRVLRARFQAPERPRGASVRLLLRHFGEEQRVFLNGACVATFAQRGSAALPELVLDDALLQSENQLALVATAYRDQRAREKAEKSPPARLRIDGPEPVWQRSLFNGLAQIIIQSTGEPGTITLTATSPGLAKATLSAPSTAPTQ
jgi:beta-galactosidase